jgi:hypothetical protein
LIAIEILKQAQDDVKGYLCPDVQGKSQTRKEVKNYEATITHPLD